MITYFLQMCLWLLQHGSIMSEPESQSDIRGIFEQPVCSAPSACTAGPGWTGQPDTQLRPQAQFEQTLL